MFILNFLNIKLIMGKKIALFYNIGSDFYNNRVHYAYYLQEMGYDVSAIVPDDGFKEKIENLGIKVFTFGLDRNSLNPLKVLKTFKSLRRHFAEENYDILHTFRLQPNILGPLAVGKGGVSKIVCHVTGLGILFSGNNYKHKFLRQFVLFFYYFAFRNVDHVIVQNTDDFDYLKRKIRGLSPRIELIKGSGINPDRYNSKLISAEDKENLLSDLKITSDSFVVTFVSRMLWYKGVNEIVESAKLVCENIKNVVFLMVGDFDEFNPNSIDSNFVKKHNNQNGMYFLGGRKDVMQILSISSLFIFPSYYREGIPRSVLEAMAMELPIVTTNYVGCKHTVEENVNGKLIPVRNSEALANAILYYANNRSEARICGLRSREKLLQEFSESIVFKQFESLYN